ncbi:unnamed protein product [Arabis nemorensis]|uniref:Uncharacterized protein n=1 Tax=Arabis nemorensis TaxID=586526 RepID=A0A565BN28_9BRAS|nr:unnamed protein product [Arabis nemorensis]
MPPVTTEYELALSPDLTMRQLTVGGQLRATRGLVGWYTGCGMHSPEFKCHLELLVSVLQLLGRILPNQSGGITLMRHEEKPMFGPLLMVIGRTPWYSIDHIGK